MICSVARKPGVVAATPVSVLPSFPGLNGKSGLVTMRGVPPNAEGEPLMAETCWRSCDPRRSVRMASIIWRARASSTPFREKSICASAKSR